MLADKTSRVAVGAIAIGLVLIIAVGLVAPAIVPVDANGRATGKALGSTGFAYLGGLRTFVAALLWNKTEPEQHRYYGADSVEKLLFLLPTLRIVTWLDPQFQQAYYVAQWIVARNGKTDEAYALTKEGIAANPHSGLLIGSYAQLAFLYSDIRSAHEAALRVLQPDVKWTDALEQWNAYSILRAIFTKSGDPANLRIVNAKLQELNAAADKLARQRARAERAEPR